jgi:hypothetical protein
MPKRRKPAGGRSVGDAPATRPARLARVDLIVLNERQIDCLVSEVREEILSNFYLHGPCAVAEVATRMNRVPEGLYHHVRLLEKVGLIRRVDVRRRGRRDEVIFDAASTKTLLKPRRWDVKYALRCERLFRAQAKAASRRLTTSTLGSGRFDLADLMLYVRTIRFRADAAKIREIRKRLRELDAFIAEQSSPQRGRAHDLFMIVAPTD